MGDQNAQLQALPIIFLKVSTMRSNSSTGRFAPVLQEANGDIKIRPRSKTLTFSPLSTGSQASRMFPAHVWKKRKGQQACCLWDFAHARNWTAQGTSLIVDLCMVAGGPGKVFQGGA